MVVKGRGVDGVGGGDGGGDLGLEWIKSKTNESWTSVSFIYLFFVLKPLPVEEDHQSGHI